MIPPPTPLDTASEAAGLPRLLRETELHQAGRGESQKTRRTEENEGQGEKAEERGEKDEEAQSSGPNYEHLGRSLAHAREDDGGILTPKLPPLIMRS